MQQMDTGTALKVKAQAPCTREPGAAFSLYWNRWMAGLPMVLLPFLLGGARPWFWSAVAALFMVGLTISIWTEESFPLGKILSSGWGLLLAIFLFYPLLQCLPLPAPFGDFLDPARIRWVQRSEGVTHLAEGLVTISYMPLPSLFAWFWWIFLAAYAILFKKALGESRDLDWLFRILYCIAAFEAFYGLLQVLIPSLGVLWESAGTGNARGTFVNRNHYANFLGMIWPLLLAHMLKIRRENDPTIKRTHAETEAIRQGRQKQWFLALLIGLILLAQFFSASRGGILSSLVALTVFMLFSGVKRGGTVFFITACWLVMLVYGSIIGFDEILARFDMVEESAPGRFKIWEDTWRMIQDHLWTGTGLGTYETVIRLYQSHLTDQFQIGHAHNDYLELAAELGVPVAAGMVLLVWGYWWKTAIGIKRRERSQSAIHQPSPTSHQLSPMSHQLSPMNHQPSAMNHQRRLIQAGALAGSAAFLCHGWVEFNWQMPANQLYFIILLLLMHHEGTLVEAGTGEARPDRDSLLTGQRISL